MSRSERYITKPTAENRIGELPGLPETIGSEAVRHNSWRQAAHRPLEALARRRPAGGVWGRGDLVGEERCWGDD